jgi:hypothetical protein
MTAASCWRRISSSLCFANFLLLLLPDDAFPSGPNGSPDFVRLRNPSEVRRVDSDLFPFSVEGKASGGGDLPGVRGREFGDAMLRGVDVVNHLFRA